MNKNLKQYLPVLGMVLVTVLSTFAAAASDGSLTSTELANLVLALLGAVTVYVVPRFENTTWLKPVLAFVTAALQAVMSAWHGGISMSEWSMIILTALGALGVTATNKHVPLTPSK